MRAEEAQRKVAEAQGEVAAAMREVAAAKREAAEAKREAAEAKGKAAEVKGKAAEAKGEVAETLMHLYMAEALLEKRTAELMAARGCLSMRGVIGGRHCLKSRFWSTVMNIGMNVIEAVSECHCIEA